MKVGLKNPKTGEIKLVKLGWSWTIFFFLQFLGLPMFLRGLVGWGSVFLVVWAAIVVVLRSPDAIPDAMLIVVGPVLVSVYVGLTFWLASEGNEMTAKNYLKRGWQFAEPDSTTTKFAREQWKINI